MPWLAVLVLASAQRILLLVVGSKGKPWDSDLFLICEPSISLVVGGILLVLKAETVVSIDTSVLTASI